MKGFCKGKSLGGVLFYSIQASQSDLVTSVGTQVQIKVSYWCEGQLYYSDI